MKKGLITAIGTIALALAGNGFAVAPTISNVPDVIIGDAEDNGSTVDVNFFRLNNALNLMNYVTLGTAPENELLFAFDETTGTGNALDFTSAAGGSPIQELAAPSAAPSLWPANQRISGALSDSFMLSIRNIALSPRPASGPDVGPFADPVNPATGQPTTISEVAIVDTREVKLFVGDVNDSGDAPGEDTITVYSKNASLDELSGTAPAYTTIFTQSTFPGAGIYTWQYSQFGYAHSNCTTSTGTGTFLSIASGGAAPAAGNGYYFGRWWLPGTQSTVDGTTVYTSPIPHVDGNIVYCAKLRLSVEGTPGGVKSLAPDIRFGADSTGSNLTTINQIYSQGSNLGLSTTGEDRDPQIPNAGESRDFKFYWSPNPAAMTETAHIDGADATDVLDPIDWRRWNLFFDILDQNTAFAGGEDSGTWKISYVEAGWMQRPADIAPVTGSSTNFKLTDLTTATGGFTLYPAAPGVNSGSVLQNNPSAGKITFSSPAVTTVPVASIYQRLATVPWAAGKVVRVTAKLSCPTQAYREVFAMARVRHQTLTPWVSQIFQIKRNPGMNAGAAGSQQVPYVPAVAGTSYECYLPSFGGPNAYVLGVAAGTDYFMLGLDHVFIGPDAATQWTVHEVLYETLDEATQLVP